MSPAFQASFLAALSPRLFTGLALAAALLTCLLLGGPFLSTALAIVSALALYEFYQMLWPGKQRLYSKTFGIVLGVAIFLPTAMLETLPVLLCTAFLWAALSFLFDYGRGNTQANFTHHLILPVGLLYIPCLLQLTLSLSLKEQFLIVASAIASDTTAYYVGCTFGRHKIWPTVSPNKSWEGSAAGFAAGIIVTTVIACFPLGDGPLAGGNWVYWLCVGALLNSAAQFGDFFESALKRSRHVKDSSGLLPGHGGILDRIDSILFTVAAYCAIRLATNAACALITTS